MDTGRERAWMLGAKEELVAMGEEQGVGMRIAKNSFENLVPPRYSCE